MLRKSALAALLGSTLLAGCATPFADRLDIDWTPRNQPGTISVSDPRMYRREALISERRDDVAWINGLIDKSRDPNTVKFAPEIFRELEQITAIAAALGLKFDPASALNYDRSKETGDIQQQMDVLKLQLQLDQLKHDYELYRAEIAAQTDPLNADLSKLGTGGVPAAKPQEAPSAADQLTAAIAALKTQLDGRFSATVSDIRPTTVTATPAQDFRDRSSYRDLLKSARNAASLDELHDMDGAALIRLNFEASLLPDTRYPRSPAVIQMRVQPPDERSGEWARVYSGWLNYVNDSLYSEAPGRLEPNMNLLASAAVSQFDKLTYYYSRPGGAACPGLVLVPPATPPEGCAHLFIAVPKIADEGPQGGAFHSLPELVRTFILTLDSEQRKLNDVELKLSKAELELKDLELEKDFLRARAMLAANAPQITQSCGTIPPVPPAGPFESPEAETEAKRRAEADAADSNDSLNYAVRTARLHVVVGEAVLNANRIAERRLQHAFPGFVPPENTTVATIAKRMESSQLFLATYEQLALSGPGCETRAQQFRDSRPQPYAPFSFTNALRTAERVAVYEIGPREQVQQVSTVARSANSLALAVSLAASAPGSGAAANAAGSYSRQAMGKASTLERLPAVVGFTNASSITNPAKQKWGSFGWVLGPRATVDPKGRVTLRHAPGTFDLAVDLTVPGWWPSFTLDTVTSWAPEVGSISAGSFEAGVPPTGGVKHTRVPMRQNNADFAAISALLAASDTNIYRKVSLQPVHGTISACQPTTLFLRGESIWRTSLVLIDGVKISSDKINVAPDMSGVMVDVDAIDRTVLSPVAARLPLRVFTPYDEATPPEGILIDYVSRKAGDCLPKEGPNAAEDAPKLDDVDPLQIVIGAEAKITMRGSNLGKIDKVTLGNKPQKPVIPDDGKSLTVTFPASETAELPVSKTIRLRLFKGDQPVLERPIEATTKAKAN